MAPISDFDRSRAAWWGIGAVLAIVLSFVLYSFIGTIVFGIFIYYSTRPVHLRIKRRVRPPSLAAMVSLLVLALPAILLILYTMAIGLQEITRFSQQFEVDVLQTYVQPYIDIITIPQTPGELLSDGGLEGVEELFGSALPFIGFIGTGALHFFIMIAIAFYLLRDDYRLSRWVTRRFSDDAGVLNAYLRAVDRSYHQIFFGNILNAVITGTIGAIAYNALNLFAPGGIVIPYPTLVGLLTGVASLIPIVGMKLVYFPTSAYLGAVVFLENTPDLIWFPVAFFVVSLVLVDTIPDLIVRPYVSGRNLHVGMVMIAYIFGPLLFGWYGIFLGPMILVLVVHFVRLVLPELMAGEPIQPVAVDPTYLTDAPVDSRSGTGRSVSGSNPSQDPDA